MVIAGRWLNYHPWEGDRNCKSLSLFFYEFLCLVFSPCFGWLVRIQWSSLWWSLECADSFSSPLRPLGSSYLDGLFLTRGWLGGWLSWGAYLPPALPPPSTLSPLSFCFPRLPPLHTPQEDCTEKRILSSRITRRLSNPRELQLTPNRLHRRAPTRGRWRPGRHRTGVSDGAVRGV